MHVSPQTWYNMGWTDAEWNVCCIVTFSESKQAMTRPFSTWQLREGWANLHSASDLEQVPLWNSRHTSRVSHLVSRPMVMLTAIRDGGGDRWTENCLMSARVTNSDAGKRIPGKTERKKQKQNSFQFSLSTNRQRVLLVDVFWGMFISSSWEMWQLRFDWGEIDGLGRAEASSVSKKEKKQKLLWGRHSRVLGYVAVHLCLHLNQLTSTLSHCYIQVNMAEAVAVSVEPIMK